MGIAGGQARYSLSQKLTTALPEDEPRAAPLLGHHLWVAVRDEGSATGTSPRCSREDSPLQTSEFNTVIASPSPPPKSSPCNLKSKKSP